MGTLQGQSPFFVPGPPAKPGEAYQPIVDFLKDNILGNTVLDLGGGQGVYALELAKMGFAVCVADVDEQSLALAKGSGLATRLLSQDSDLGVKIADTVVMVEVLEHVQSPARFLAQAIRATRKRVLLTVPCSDDFQVLFSHGLSYAHIAVSDHLWHFSDKEMESLLQATGLTYHIDKGDPLFPRAGIHLLRTSFRWHWLGRLAVLPLRVADRLGWLTKRIFSRYYCVVDVEG
jgi:SAM-dependent methyltransferase